MRTSFSKATAASLLGLLVLAACSSAPQPKFQQEQFDTGASPFARNFNASTTDTCEAARRALLSQGYMTTLTHPDTVDGTKNFQPTGDSHIVVEFHVVCTPGEETSDTSIVYVNAVQNGFALKKSDTSASVGLSVLGSLSLPIRSNNDAMVKISSETIPSGTFYDRFFALVESLSADRRANHAGQVERCGEHAASGSALGSGRSTRAGGAGADAGDHAGGGAALERAERAGIDAGSACCAGCVGPPRHDAACQCPQP